MTVDPFGVLRNDYNSSCFNMALTMGMAICIKNNLFLVTRALLEKSHSNHYVHRQKSCFVTCTLRYWKLGKLYVISFRFLKYHMTVLWLLTTIWQCCEHDINIYCTTPIIEWAPHVGLLSCANTKRTLRSSTIEARVLPFGTNAQYRNRAAHAQLTDYTRGSLCASDLEIVFDIMWHGPVMTALDSKTWLCCAE